MTAQQLRSRSAKSGNRSSVRSGLGRTLYQLLVAWLVISLTIPSGSAFAATATDSSPTASPPSPSQLGGVFQQ